MDNLYRHTVVVQSLANSQNATGTANPTYSTRFAALKCLLQPKTLKNMNEFGKLTVRNIVKMFCSYQPTITVEDRVVSTQGVFAGTYEILGIKDAGGQANHLEIELELVK